MSESEPSLYPIPLLCTRISVVILVSSADVLLKVKAESWKAPGALARYAAILFSFASKGTQSELDAAVDYLRGLAGLSLDKRVRVMTNWYALTLHLTYSGADALHRQAGQTASETMWKRTHELFVEAFYTPKTPSQAKLLSKLKGKGELPPDVDRLFSEYDGFLLGLGKMSLSQLASLPDTLSLSSD